SDPIPVPQLGLEDHQQLERLVDELAFERVVGPPTKLVETMPPAVDQLEGHRTRSGTRRRVGTENRPLGLVGSVEAREPPQIPIEEAQLMLDLGPAGGDQRQTIRLG